MTQGPSPPITFPFSHVNRRKVNNLNMADHSLYLCNVPKSIDNRKIYTKIFFHYKNNFIPTFGMVDSGSDCSIIQLSAALQIADKRLIYTKTKYSINLSTYNNQAIKVLNIVKLPVFLGPHKPAVHVDFLITNNVPTAPRILLGLDFIKTTGCKISYLPNQHPSVQITKPFLSNLDTGFVNDLELRTCTARINLAPREEKAVLFQLNRVNHVLPGDKIMIDDVSNRLGNPYVISLSSSPLLIDPDTHDYFAAGMVYNLSDLPLRTEATAVFDVLLDKVEHFTAENSKAISNMTFLFDTFPTTIKPRNGCNFTLNSIPADDHDEVKISRSMYNISLQNSSVLESPESELSDDIKESFKDPNSTIILDTDFEQDIPHTDIYDPSGLEISDIIKMDPKDIVDLPSFDENLRPYIKTIFLDKYPSLLATNTLDKGCLSTTLGKYTIQLNSSETLPRQRKIYYLGKMEAQHLRDILEFHLRARIIKKVDHRGDKIHHFASPAYLVPRSKPGAPSRLIIDFKALNSFIKYESVALPEISSILNSLRDCQFFTSTDLSNAYNSIELEESCTYLTTFSTQHGSFQMRTLPQGLSVSPEIFNRYIQKALNERIIYDKSGQPMRDKNNIILTEYDPIDGVHIYYDDLIIGSPLGKTVTESIEKHFAKVDLIMGRLHSHNAKINFSKSSFCKPQIKFLGWLVRNNFLIADPQRVDKMRDAAFPDSKKGIRSFCGLVNSMRSALGARTLEKIHILTPLTSSVTPYNPTKKHFEAFEILKRKLTEKPIFSKIINISAPKFLFCDASSARDGYYSAVLLQMIDPNKEKRSTRR